MQIAATPKTRLFSPVALVANSELSLTGEQAKYVMRVLRLRADDAIVLFDGKGGQYNAIIESFNKDHVLVQVGEHHTVDIESPLEIRLVQGISRGGRMDVVIQKSTELGVRRITPVITEFSVVKLGSDRAARRQEHWRKVSQSACEQCGRNIVPEIDLPQNLSRWLEMRDGAGRAGVMLDPASTESLSSMPVPESGVELLIGPEGGLSDAERAQCLSSGFKPVSLGPRVLRTETAALAGIAVLQSLWGDFG